MVGSCKYGAECGYVVDCECDCCIVVHPCECEESENDMFDVLDDGEPDAIGEGE